MFSFWLSWERKRSIGEWTRAIRYGTCTHLENDFYEMPKNQVRTIFNRGTNQHTPAITRSLVVAGVHALRNLRRVLLTKYQTAKCATCYVRVRRSDTANQVFLLQWLVHKSKCNSICVTTDEGPYERCYAGREVKRPILTRAVRILFAFFQWKPLAGHETLCFSSVFLKNDTPNRWHTQNQSDTDSRILTLIILLQSREALSAKSTWRLATKCAACEAFGRYTAWRHDRVFDIAEAHDMHVQKKHSCVHTYSDGKDAL